MRDAADHKTAMIALSSVRPVHAVVLNACARMSSPPATRGGNSIANDLGPRAQSGGDGYERSICRNLCGYIAEARQNVVSDRLAVRSLQCLFEFVIAKKADFLVSLSSECSALRYPIWCRRHGRRRRQDLEKCRRFRPAPGRSRRARSERPGECHACARHLPARR